MSRKTGSYFAFFLFLTTGLFASTINVKDTVTGDGTHDSLAFTDVQAAIASAADGRSVTGTTTAGSNIVTITSGTMTVADQGKVIGEDTNTKVGIFSTIATVTSSTQIILSVPAIGSGSGLTLKLGGDTVALPAGTVSWPTAISLTKCIWLKGAGKNLTNITYTGAAAVPIITANLVSSDYFVLISGLTLSSNNEAGGSAGFINVGNNNVAGYPRVCFRIWDIRFNGDPLNGVSTATRFIQDGGEYGLIDHCDFIGTTTRTAGNVSMLGDNNKTTINNLHTPIARGDINDMYVENCTWDMPSSGVGNGGMDNYAGSKWILRYSIMHNTNASDHGFDSDNRGSSWFEIYHNTFDCKAGVSGYFAHTIRSGTGNIFSNNYTNLSGVGGGQGILYVLQPYYYGATTNYAAQDLNRRPNRSIAYSPKGVWGVKPYGGGVTTPNSTNDGYGNRITGTNPIDGNTPGFGHGHMDATLSRTVNDLQTNAGSKIIHSATINFTSADLPRVIRGTNIDYDGRTFADGVITSGSNIIDSATANFTANDVGRGISAPANENAGGIPDDTRYGGYTRIASVTNSTRAVMTHNSLASASGVKVILSGCYIASITNSTDAVLNIPATGTTSSGTVTLGYQDAGYPCLDMPGWGSFPSANAGNWPTVTTGYAAADYEQLDPIYMWNNTLSGPTTIGQAQVNQGAEGLLKVNREWYEPNASFTGASGCGWGTLASRPATCTKGVGYFATDQGATNGDGSKTGILYRATATNTWTAVYQPLIYPHPMITNMSGFVPLANLLAWYRADSLPLTDGANIPMVTDSSGMGNTLTGAGAVVFRTNIINGKPVMRFNGTTSSKLTLAGASINTDHTFFIVVSESSQVSFAGLFGSAGNDGIYLTNGKFNYLYSVSHYANTLLANNTFYVLEAVSNGGSLTFYRNGVPDGTASFFPGFVATRIGNSLVGDIAEILDYGSISTSDRSTVRQYLGNKYGIAVAP